MTVAPPKATVSRQAENPSLFIVPTAVKSIAELDLKHAILPPDCSGNAPAGEVKWQSASEDVN
jgi:hypothetical protein